MKKRNETAAAVARTHVSTARARPLRCKLVIALAGACSAMSGAHACAQASDGALPEIVVSGQGESDLKKTSTAGGRLPLTPLEVPASVAVISGDTIRERGYPTLLDAQTRAPGISSVPFSGNGNNSLSARGFYGPNSISQLYDGLQLYNAGGVVTFPFDPWNVERVEFLNGPASVLYGTGFVGGAVNVVPKKPDVSKQSNEVQLSAGSFGTWRQAIDSTGPLNDQWAYRINASHTNSDGWMDRGRNDSLTVSAALAWQATKELSFTLSNDYGDIHPGSYEGTPIANGSVIESLRYRNFNVDDADVRFTENRTYLRMRYQATPDVVFNNDVYLIKHERRYKETYTYTYNPATRNVVRSNYRDIIGYQTQYGDHGYATINGELFGRKNQLVAGFDFNRSLYDRNDNTNASGNFPGSSTVSAFNFTPGVFAQGTNASIRYLYRVTLDQAGLFLQDRYQLSDRWAVSGGVRGDNYQTRRDDMQNGSSASGNVNAMSWNAGVVFNPVRDTALYAQYAVASDPATSLASISASQMQYAVSKGKQVELGVKQSLWDGKLDWTLAAYRIIKSNLLTPNINNSSLSDTVGQQSSRGLEASIVFKPVRDWRIEANASILQAQFDDFVASVSGKPTSLRGYRPQFVPKRTANLFLAWNFQPQWEARTGAHYVSDRYSDNTDQSRLPAYTVLDAGLAWRATERLRVDFRIDNLTDRIYAASTYAGTATQWILGAPRSYTLTMNYAF
ncbi:MAG: Ferrichrome outer membrane transporter/phage receptor [Herbaspirillum frisingense]|uniref:Ferrichrome outer membrane transporter/phage receptor n=1 Tax=Herbaspirillum frisingense TaxID=92645 RepID=A0A7V8FVP7_9BURK|nr:MAG: Ferrichrome outer membrane transporter/phage receptor [Herbaspirillum frisingense]